MKTLTLTIALTTNTITELGQNLIRIKNWKTMIKLTFASSLIVGFLIPKNGFSQLSATIAVLNNISCNTTCDGQAEVTVTNGLPPYTYMWNDPSTQSTTIASNLCPIKYSVTVTDANSDTIILDIIIKTVTDSYIDLINITTATDTISCNGVIGIITGGPQGTYSYNWSNGDTTNNISGLCPGSYTVTILDNAVCLYSWTGIITYDEVTNVLYSDNNIDRLKVWPNPAKENITFEIKDSNNENHILTVYGATGQQIKTINISKRIQAIDTRDFAGGLYIYQIQRMTDQKVIGQGKFIKE